MNPKIKHVFKFILVLTLIFNTAFFNNLAVANENSIQHFGWGGGGAFTSTALLNDDIYLSSDVAGVWKQNQGRWQPFVIGLENYNVTALATFNNKLFAITTDELFVTDGNGDWATTNVKLNTYRSTNDQPYAISADERILCIANRNHKIECIDNNDQLVSYTAPVAVINGVYFDKVDSSILYFFSGAELHTLNLTTHFTELVDIFNDKIVSITTFSNKVLIATSKNVYDITQLDQTMYEVTSNNIVNFFSVKDNNSEDLFINTGGTWYTKLKKLDFVEGSFVLQQNAKEFFDSSLPHRPYQKNLTKFLGVSTLEGKTFVTDYWGVYQLQIDSNEGVLNIVEVSSDAVNTVATDLVVSNDNLYVSAMDNGVVKIAKSESNLIPQYQALAFDRLQGHGWSLLQDGETIHAIISPWDDANDYLFSYNEIDDISNITQLTDYSLRKAVGSFWGQGYSRQLADYNGIISFRDGDSGGLVSDGINPIELNDEITIGDLNRVYRSIVVQDGLLYIANCEGASTLVAIDEWGEVVQSKPLPNGFCPFTAYSYHDSLYLLGSNSGKSVIYKFSNDEFSLLLKESVGSAFYQMAINPLDDQQIVAGTITWSNRATSGLYVSNDGGNTFFDKSCLLSHKNGVAAIKFESDRAYILQKIGGGIAVPASILFSENECGVKDESQHDGVVNFNLLTMQAYGGAQDTTKGTVSIEDDGITLKVIGNRWRAANFDYVVTPNTVIEFEFKSSVIGEIHGIGLDKDLALSAHTTFNLYGKQTYGREYFRYSGSDDYEYFSIPIGQFYSGYIKYLFFAMDHDVGNPNGESYFRNVKVVER